MAHATERNEVPVARFERVPRAMLGAAVALIVVGAASFIAALAVDPSRAWRAYLFNWLFFTSVSMGAVMFAVVVSMTRGVWSRPVRRIALSFVAFLPLAYVLMIPLFFAADHIFPWLHGGLQPGKEVWLNVPFLAIRQLVALAAMFTLTLVFTYWALRPDLGMLREQAPGKLGPLYARLSRSWQGQEREEARAHAKMAVLGPIIALTFAVSFSLVAWDFVMSLESHWFSTLIGPYFFMAGFLGGIAATGLLAIGYTRALGVEHVFAGPQRHDLGKLTFAFCVFWAYLLFSQYIVIWYGNLTVEQSFIIHRFEEPYKHLAQAIFLCMFALPFFGLLGVTPKMKPVIYSIFASIILFGLWLERFLLVYPSHYPGAESLPLGWQEFGVGLLFAGLLLATLAWFATRFPLFQIWLPISELTLEGTEVEVGATR